jgi:hypothetical protein
MTLVAKQSYHAKCDLCGEIDNSSETGSPWYYDDPQEALKLIGESGWFVAPDGRLICPWCVEKGSTLPRLRCTCPAGRGTNPGCPVCP